MKTILKTIAQTRAGVMLTVAAALLGTASNVIAKDKPAEEVTVIAHIALPQTTVSKMFLQRENGRQYLYIQQASQQGFTIVDVTKPNKPTVAGRRALPNTAANGKLQVFRDGFAIAETPETPSGTEPPHQEPAPTQVQETGGASHLQSVRVLDMSDPANPRTVKRFEGVTSLVPDEGRNLIYITNSEGLWILRHKRPPAHQICDSESVFSPIADCYAY